MLWLTVPPQELTVVRTQQAPNPLAHVPSMVPPRPTHSEEDRQTPRVAPSSPMLQVNIAFVLFCMAMDLDSRHAFASA